MSQDDYKHELNLVFCRVEGDKGDTGATGSKGATSAAGKDGLSAYELAVQQGFTGTLDEWLASLKATAN
ncbi:hypothetical protein J7E23_14715 [Pseudomonas sp. ISL-88]|uniref:hypothetical protein n=1 Tax=Bacteria TaxID=2 RepID=UPI001BEB5262|nr:MULTISPECIES: hypothetical protein [Bacteria]MBT2714079.1 hypothetical protein [Pseudomonas sp. ISL-88]